MVLGPRFLIEAGFIVAVAVVAGVADLSTWAIIGVVAAAWILVALVELFMWSRHAVRRPPARTPEPAPQPKPEPVVIRQEPVRTPEPPMIAAAPPPPEPQPEPEPELEAEPDPVVVYLPVSEEPREWNLWELERLAREHAGDDVAKNEERAYLLMYLRDFAGPDGNLPTDFDGLVRDAFGDLLRVAAS